MVNLYPILAQVVTFVDDSTGLTLIRVLGWWAAAVTTVIVARGFVNSIRIKTKGQSRIIDQYKITHAESQRKFQDQLDRLCNRQVKAQHDFQHRIGRISDTQNIVLHDVIAMMKNVEGTNGRSSVTIDGMQATVGTLRKTVRMIDTLLRTPVGEDPKPDLVRLRVES